MYEKKSILWYSGDWEIAFGKLPGCGEGDVGSSGDARLHFFGG